MRMPALILTFLCAACGGAGSDPRPTPEPDAGGDTAPLPAEHTAPEAPWSGAPLPEASVPDVLVGEWRAADNRTWCAPLAPATAEPQATPRAARFAGGWGVAYDLPDMRGAYGIAGTGVEPGPETYDEWPHQIRWADGSHAGYGPEGGRGPKQLAYVRVAGEACLYNVWSMLGQRHLEDLLQELRRVAVSTPG
jgi:hypothetical protein